jgi:uncharacterized protein (TIGR00297 family)
LFSTRELALQITFANWWPAAATSLVFSALAYAVRGVTTSGAIAGAAMCFLLYTAVGSRAVAVLVIIFLLAWLSTRFGYQKKQRLGTAEARSGRTASQVVANLSLGTACACAYAGTNGKSVFLLAMAAAFSEAAADTVSSEFGQATSKSARLVTTWETVPAGTNGGISLPGTIAGISATIVVSVSCAIFGLVSWKWAAFSALAGAIGMIADSFLGALLEQRRIMNNDAVNFAGTTFAAIAALLLV